MLLIILYLILSLACHKKVTLTVESLTFYTKYQLFFTKQEKKLFKSLPDRKSREEFIKEFWEAMDPIPATEENEFKNEIDERINYADRFFKEMGKSGHQTDRGRVYLLLGPPDNIFTRSAIESSDNTATLIWNYDRWRVAAMFIDKHGFGVFRLRSYDLRFLRLLTMLKHANIKYFDTNKKKLNIRLIEP
ncbi:MAG: GWxTD domain-containing protein, partial [Candidatus Aminicenantes bacterium]|nr:GWxTD domain-containing protein [Candidatus Aminicenantes bacterium]